jgi:nucleotide-binding universal stress UspA family protein
MYTGLGTIEETLPELLQTDTPAARHLRWGAEILDQLGLRAELELRHGVAAEEILREALEGDYDLIVIGARYVASRLRGLLMGDVTRQIVDRAPCPTLVVRPSGR